MTAKQPKQPKQAKPPKQPSTSKSPSSPSRRAPKPERSRGSPAPDLLATLQTRFEAHPQRHPGIPWAMVAARLQAKPAALRSLAEMERTGGEPDVVAQDESTGEVIFFDCSPETPAGRVSLCYDEAALAARKLHKPRGSATELAAAIGIELLTEAQYLHLQQLGEFDTRTSSWLCTPAPMRALGGALFGDRRFGRVFLYHNGAESYYAARGCRGALRV
ncbi:MAG: DUF4256 domain-containing protein [Planctomycetes bacterium]|nr:DUF4256 domain-containing protein [Planctomycetota bacterium]